MFGKKQGSAASSAKPPPAAKPKKEETKAKEKEESQDEKRADPPLSAEPIEAPDKPEAKEEVAEAKAPEAPKPEKSDKPKKLKSMDEDPLLEPEEEGEEGGAGESADDSMTSLRLQRAQSRIWLDLRDGIDLKALARMKADEAKEEVNSAVEEIARFRNLDLTPAELKRIAKECADDMLGFGPLEELLEMDGIADIMINGPKQFILNSAVKFSAQTLNSVITST